VTSRLGLPEDQARKATGGILDVLRNHLQPEDFDELRQKLPGSDEMLQLATGETGQPHAIAGTAPVLFTEQKSPNVQGPQKMSTGGLVQAASHAIGGVKGLGGGLSGILALLSDYGISADKASGFVSMFLEYVRNKAGGGMMDSVLQQVPGLSALSPAAATPRP
jgi:hypothetical protein